VHASDAREQSFLSWLNLGAPGRARQAALARFFPATYEVAHPTSFERKPKAASERDGDCEFTTFRQIDLRGQRDVTVPGCLKFPVHFKVVHQVMPAVAKADIADRPAREVSAACHDEVNPVALRVDQFAIAYFRILSGVTGAKPIEVQRGSIPGALNAIEFDAIESGS
jgi:hypothetical protein